MGSEEFEELLSRINDKALTDKDREKLLGLMKGFWFFMNNFLDSKMTKAQLRKLVELGIIPTDFSADNPATTSEEADPESSSTDGPPTEAEQPGQDEKSQNIDDSETEQPSECENDQNSADIPPEGSEENKKDCAAGESTRDEHGRRGYSDFAPGTVVNYGIEGLTSGMTCPGCFEGILRPYKNGVVLRIEETAPLAVIHHLLEKYRCDGCSTIFSTDTAGYVEKGFGRYSFGAIAAIAVYRYGYGFPFHRQEEILGYYDLPISDSAMWDHVFSGYHIIKFLVDAYWAAASNGNMIRIDDGTARVIKLRRAIEEELLKARQAGLSGDSVRTGIHTTCVYAETEDGVLRLFDTGRHHCGEKFWEMVESREENLPELMRMTDCGSTNTETPAPKARSADSETAPSKQRPTPLIIFLYCLQHARDRFVKLRKTFPLETKKILRMLAEVYENDEKSKNPLFEPKERLKFHQENSKPIMENLKSWCQAQMDSRLIEPNSGLGKEVIYFLKHYHDITGFLRHEGAPLDNNLCEQTVKAVKRHLKASQAYLTVNGAMVGDCYMTLIESAKLADISPIEYIGNCFYHADILKENPEQFLPWNYRETMKTLPKREGFHKRTGPSELNFSVPAIFKSESGGLDRELLN
jgi:transposase